MPMAAISISTRPSRPGTMSCRRPQVESRDMAFSLTWLPEVLENAGLKVAEQPGWRTRGHRDLGQIRRLLSHHTAGPTAGNKPRLGIVTNGRPGLAGPLA